MMGFIWFWLVAVMIVGYVVLDGFDLGVGVLHLFLVRTEAERRATLALHRPGVGRQRSLAAGRRRHALLRLSAALRLGLQRILSAAHDRALAADSARRQPRIAQPHRRGRVAHAARRRLRALQRAAHHLLRRGAGQRASAAFHCRPTATSFCRSGPTGSPASAPAFSTGTPSSAASSRWSRSRCTALSGSPSRSQAISNSAPAASSLRSG